jgi:hypothetical protein
MTFKVHDSAKRLRNRHARLLTLEEGIRKQINDADCLLETLDDYCQENPNEKPCAADDPGWREQIVRQRESLHAMLTAVREKLK